MPQIKSERRKIYLERKERGFCPRCGNKITTKPKTVFCEDCLAYYRKYQKENSETISENRRANYTERKKSKRCARCGKFLPTGYRKTLCVKCLEKAYKITNGRERPKTANKNNFKKLIEPKPQ